MGAEPTPKSHAKIPNLSILFYNETAHNNLKI